MFIMPKIIVAIDLISGEKVTVDNTQKLLRAMSKNGNNKKNLIKVSQLDCNELWLTPKL